MTTLLAVLIVVGEWTGLARAILGAPYYAGLLDVMLVCLFAAAVAGAARRRVLPALHPLDLLVAAYFVLAAVQILNPNVPSPIVGLEGFRKTAFTILGYAVVRLASDKDGLRFLAIVALGSLPALGWAIRQSISVLPIELAIIESSGASPISFHAGVALRAFAPTAGPFHLGILAGSVMLIGLVFASLRSLRWLLVSVVAGIALGLSITRANIIAATIAAGAMVLLTRPWPERLRTAALAAPALAAALLAVSAAVAVSPALAPDPVDGPLPSAVPATATPLNPNPLEDRSIQFRLLFWAEQLAAVRDQPLIGYGTSAAADGFGDDYAGTGSRNFQPHSLFLKPAIELGIPGLVIFLGILAALGLTLRATVDAGNPLWLATVGIVLLTTISGITGPMLDAYPFNLLFWSLIGFLPSLPVRRGAKPSPARSA